MSIGWRGLMLVGYGGYRQGTALLAGMLAIAPVHDLLAQDSQHTLELQTITIEAESDDTLVQDGYVATQSRVGTKVDTPILQIPQAVSVITQDQIEDQKPRTLNEALEYTASANSNTFGYDSRYDAYFLRGFNAHYDSMFRDGLREFNGPSAWFNTEPYGIEGITILKGPASSLYGVSGSGGIVNVVTKRPKEEPFREVELLVGQNNRRQAGFDFSGPVNENGTILYRLTGLGRLSDTDLKGFSDDKLFLAPAVTFQPNRNTKLTILGEYSKAVTGGTAAFHNPTYGAISDIYLGDPDWNDFTRKQTRIGYEFEHRVNETLTIRQNFRRNSVDADIQYAYLRGAPPARNWGQHVEEMTSLVVDNMAQFDFNTGSVRHLAVAGIDYSQSDYETKERFSGTSPSAIRNSPFSFGESQRTDVVGVYLHDQMEWNNFTIFASGRHDWLDTESLDSSRTKIKQYVKAFSSRLGVSYRTEWGITPYANFSNSFAPNTGFVLDGNSRRVARPTIATQKEVGVKYEIPGHNTLITAALFDIDQEDGVVFDATSTVNQQRQLDLNSRGFEIEANASFDNGFGLIASYTALRMKIKKGVPGTEGNELSATPNHAFALWGSYEFDHGAFDGLTLGAGLRHLSSSFGDDINSFKNSARSFVDASLSYDLGKINPDFTGVSFQVNGKNLFDEQKKNCSAGFCYRDEGRTIYASLRFRF